MLWGGLLMALALIISLAFLNKESRRLAALIGGAGFGTFIDELGKFVTSDNDYFFEPTFALIYVICILLFFLVRAMMKSFALTQKEYAMNAIEVVKEVVYYDLDEDEERLALSYLDKSDSGNPVVSSLRKMLHTMNYNRVKKDVSFLTVGKRKLMWFYRSWSRGKTAAKTTAYAFIAFSCISTFQVAVQSKAAWGFWQWGAAVSTLTSFVFILIGVMYQGKKRRLRAYEYYRKAVIVSILLTQFFRFYAEQLSALVSLIISLAIYAALITLIEQERLLKLSEKAAQQPRV